jgi:hypothetical protein
MAGGLPVIFEIGSWLFSPGIWWLLSREWKEALGTDTAPERHNDIGCPPDGVASLRRICLRHGIGHRLTQPNHPWTNGQVERMNRTIKEATVKRFFYDTHEQLKAHLSTSSQPTTSLGDQDP